MWDITFNVPKFSDLEKCSLGSWIPGSQLFAHLLGMTDMLLMFRNQIENTFGVFKTHISNYPVHLKEDDKVYYRYDFSKSVNVK